MSTRAQRWRIDRKDRVERLARHRGKLKMLQAMIEEYEQIDSDEARAELRRLKVRARTLEQMIKYMNVDDASIDA